MKSRACVNSSPSLAMTAGMGLAVLCLGLTQMASAALPFLLWLDSPSRINRFDSKSPFFVVPSTPTLVSTLSFTPSPSVSPTQSSSPTFTETSTISATISPSFSPSPSVTETFSASPSFSDTMTSSPSPSSTPTLTRTPAPVLFENFDAGPLNSPADYGDVGYSLTYALDSAEFVSAPNSLKLNASTAGWGAGFNVQSNYFNGAGVVDASGNLSAVLRIKTDTDLYFTVRFKEGSATEAGGDLENWESRMVFVPAGAAWQTVSLNLYQFQEDPWDPDCNPSFLAPALSPCNTMGDNALGLQSIKRFEIEFLPLPGPAQVWLDDIGFSVLPSAHNGDWPVVSNYNLDVNTVLHLGDMGLFTDKEGPPACPTSSSKAGISRISSGGWDGGAYASITATVDSTPDCGWAFFDYWIYLDGDHDLSAYTGLRLHRRHTPVPISATVYLGTGNDACAGGWNSASAIMACGTSWGTSSIPFSSFTDNSGCPYVGSGMLGQVGYILIVVGDPNASVLDLDDIAFY